MEGRCERHTFEAAEAICRHCGYEFCHECLVYTHRQKRPPLCVKCAITAAGVRSTASVVPRASPRDIKKDIRARTKAGPRAPMAGGPVSLDWDVPDDDEDPFADAIEEVADDTPPPPAKRRRLALPKGRKHEDKDRDAVPEDPFASIPPLPPELTDAADRPAPALIDPLRTSDPNSPTGAPRPRAAPPMLPVHDPRPLVIDELEPEPFDLLASALPTRDTSTRATPTDAGGTPIPPSAPPAALSQPAVPIASLQSAPASPFPAPAEPDPFQPVTFEPAAFEPAPASAAPFERPEAAAPPPPPPPPAPPAPPTQVTPATTPPPLLDAPVAARQLVDPLAHEPVAGGPAPFAASAPAPAPAQDPFAPQMVVGPRIIDDGAAPEPFPGPRAADALPQRTPRAELPAHEAMPRPAPAAAPSPADAAHTSPVPPPAAAPAPSYLSPVAGPVPAAAPAPLAASAEPSSKGFWRLMPSSIRGKVEERRSVTPPEESVDLSSFPGLGPIGPPRSERPLKTLAEMRPDELDDGLADVTDLYDRVSDQNATTL